MESKHVTLHTTITVNHVEVPKNIMSSEIKEKGIHNQTKLVSYGEVLL